MSSSRKSEGFTGSETIIYRATRIPPQPEVLLKPQIRTKVGGEGCIKNLCFCYIALRNLFPAKVRENKIDAVVALLMAVGRAQAAEAESAAGAAPSFLTGPLFAWRANRPAGAVGYGGAAAWRPKSGRAGVPKAGP